ncbi:MAG: glycosyltransferase [Christensenella sp.]|nr:glycosyltransferase [Christensenella sp.]
MGNEPVRVLMVLTVRFAKNGIANSVLNTVSRLDPARVRCDLVSPNEPDAEAKAAFERTGGRVFVLGGRNRNPIAYLRRLADIVRSREIEVLHAHGNSATLYTEMRAGIRGGAGARFAHSHNTTCKMKFADSLLRGAFYRSYTDAIACSKAAGEWLFPNRPFTVLNNAVETGRYRYSEALRAETRAALGLSDESFAVLHVGAFNAQKNQAFLLGAFANLLAERPNARLLLVGDGDRRASCEALCRQLGISNAVSFLGWREDIPALLSAADAFALPSLHEGLPLTIVEAQCAGLPCVVSDRVTPETALTELVSFCPIESERAFADELLGTPRNERKAASDAGIAQVRTAGFDAQENAIRLMELYESRTGRTEHTTVLKNEQSL